MRVSVTTIPGDKRDGCLSAAWSVTINGSVSELLTGTVKVNLKILTINY